MARKVDDLGRIVLPVELRRLLGIEAGDELEIAVDAASILLTKIETRCVFCSSTDDLSEYLGKRICSSCTDGLRTPHAADGAGSPAAWPVSPG